MIEKCDFGSIKIKGRTYTTDVLITTDGRISDNWWRRHGHRLTLADIENLISDDPEVIVIGTGIYGRMIPEPGLEKALNNRGIELVIDTTSGAVGQFNHLSTTRKTAAGFHLTC